MLKITIVVGNPKPASRTGAIAEKLARRVFSEAQAEFRVIDLADHVGELFQWPSDSMAALNSEVADAHCVFFASPTYKATYTGLLKTFLDRYPQNGLQNIVAIAMMTGGGAAHSMGPTVNLAPLLNELGASVPVRGLYFNIEKMDRIDELIEAAATEILSGFLRLQPLMQALGPQTQSPPETIDAGDEMQ